VNLIAYHLYLVVVQRYSVVALTLQHIIHAQASSPGVPSPVKKTFSPGAGFTLKGPPTDLA
jgi:hypothetical protein